MAILTNARLHGPILKTVPWVEDAVETIDALTEALEHANHCPAKLIGSGHCLKCDEGAVLLRTVKG
jgi:hypothetical protein